MPNSGSWWKLLLAASVAAEDRGHSHHLKQFDQLVGPHVSEPQVSRRARTRTDGHRGNGDPKGGRRQARAWTHIFHHLRNPNWRPSAKRGRPDASRRYRALPRIYSLRFLGYAQVSTDMRPRSWPLTSGGVIIRNPWVKIQIWLRQICKEINKAFITEKGASLGRDLLWHHFSDVWGVEDDVSLRGTRMRKTLYDLITGITSPATCQLFTILRTTLTNENLIVLSTVIPYHATQLLKPLSILA